MRVSFLAPLVVASALTVGCASAGGIPEPFPRPGGAPRRAPSPAPVGTSGTVRTPDAYAITGTALGLRGAPYRNGGADPRGFDCSGFISYVFAQHGIPVPRTVEDLYDAGTDVARPDLQPGDLVFFWTSSGGGSSPTHVGMAIGGDEFVHAPSGAGVVRVERLSTSYWARRYVGAKRVM